jgi:hypothetical protein
VLGVAYGSVSLLLTGSNGPLAERESSCATKGTCRCLTNNTMNEDVP